MLMENKQSIPPDTKEVIQEEDRSSLATTLISLIIGALVLISIPALGVYLFLHFRKSDAKPAVSSATHVTSQMPGQGSSQNAGQTTTQEPAQTATNTKPYSDIAGYSVKIPQNWEAFKRIGSGNAYQIGFRPQGSGDVPVTINSITAATGSVNDWITVEFGLKMPRVQKKVNGRNAVYVQNPTNGTVSYFFQSGQNLYQVSGVTALNYISVFNKILSSFILSQ